MIQSQERYDLGCPNVHLNHLVCTTLCTISVLLILDRTACGYAEGLLRLKEECLMIILGYFSPVLHKNVCCGYAIEAPQWGTSNEYPQHMFLWRNKKNYLRIITKYPLMSPLDSHSFYCGNSMDVLLQFPFACPFYLSLLCFWHTVFTLSIRTPQLLTIYVLKFKPVQFTTRCCV